MPFAYVRSVHVFHELTSYFVKLSYRQLITARDRVKNGLKKLLETNELVDTMQVQAVFKKSQCNVLFLVYIKRDEIWHDRAIFLISEYEKVNKILSSPETFMSCWSILND